MSEYITEKEYYIAEDASGTLYIYIKAKSNRPQMPKIIYDGFDHAVFVRSANEKIILDYINPQVRDKLRKAKEVVVVETVLENIKAVMETGKVLAFSLVSVTFVNGMPGQDIRTLNAMRMLGAGLENWKTCPSTTAQ